MTEEKAVETFHFDGVEYSFDDIGSKGKYIIEIIQELQKESNSIKKELDKVTVSLQAFSDLLKTELPKTDEEEEYEVEEEEA